MTLKLNPNTQLITFDTYGTLIDWEGAITEYIRAALQNKGEDIDPKTFYRVWYYGFALPALKGPFRIYRDLLQHTFKQALEAHRIPVDASDGLDIGDAMAAAEPFPDAVAALAALKKKYRLATISNSQDDILAESNRKLGNAFDIMITGETTHTYKPNPALFHLVLARAGVTVNEAVHVAQSQYVDLPQSVPMGLQTIWINRQRQKLLPQTPTPQLELHNLVDLPNALGL
jgi:2-haloacid dehalogenase